MMTPGVIRRMIKAWESADKKNLELELADYISLALNQMAQVRITIRDLNIRLEKLKEEYESSCKQIRQEIRSAQNNCPHPDHSFHVDPAGGSDSYFQCDNCGLISKRGFKK